MGVLMTKVSIVDRAKTKFKFTRGDLIFGMRLIFWTSISICLLMSNEKNTSHSKQIGLSFVGIKLKLGNISFLQSVEKYDNWIQLMEYLVNVNKFATFYGFAHI